MEPEISLILIVLGGIVAFFLLLYLLPVNLWFTAQLSNVRISLLNLVLMRLRKVPPAQVTNAMITSTKAGLRITTNEIETHYLAGGNVNRVIKALISAATWPGGTFSMPCSCPSTRRSSIRHRWPPWPRTASSSSPRRG